MIGKWLYSMGSALGDSMDTGLAGTSENQARSLDAERLAAHLLVEVARADFGIDEAELLSIKQSILQTSSLSAQEVGEIVDQACAEVDSTVSYHGHIKVINDTFSREQKCQLLEHMWRVAYADESLDRYEEAFIRRFSDLIYLKHRDFMQSKHNAAPS